MQSLTHAESAMAASDAEPSPRAAPFDQASLAGEMALALYRAGDYSGASGGRSECLSCVPPIAREAVCSRSFR